MVSLGTFLPKPCLFAVRWPNSWFSRLLGDDISDILVPGWWVGSFWACFAFFLLPLRFSYLPGRPSWMCLFDVAHFEFLIEIFKNFCNADCRTLQSNHMLSATSQIELEFLTNFLNMSQFQNRLILLYQRVPLHFRFSALCDFSSKNIFKKFVHFLKWVRLKCIKPCHVVLIWPSANHISDMKIEWDQTVRLGFLSTLCDFFWILFFHSGFPHFCCFHLWCRVFQAWRLNLPVSFFSTLCGVSLIAKKTVFYFCWVFCCFKL